MTQEEEQAIADFIVGPVLLPGPAWPKADIIEFVYSQHKQLELVRSGLTKTLVKGLSAYAEEP